MPEYTDYRVSGTEPVELVTLTDQEILSRFNPQVALSANKYTVSADGVDFVTITAQLKSVPLTDGTQINLALVHTVLLVVVGMEITLETDANGCVTHELDFADAGVYAVHVQNLHSNRLEITAV